jgi:ATP-dependent helicase/DNAse subunit B
VLVTEDQMPITLLVAPAASGKTKYCIQRVREIHTTQPLANTWVVLPDWSQVFNFRRRLASAGGVIGPRVGTFDDLHREILRQAGLLLPRTSEPIGNHLLLSAIHSLMDKKQLDHYASIAYKPGFLSVIRTRITELKRARVTPQQFLSRAKQSDAALTELGRIYEAYEAALDQLGWADREGFDWRAAEALEVQTDLASNWAFLAVDGFDSFNSSQLATLKALSKRLPEILITLPGEVNRSRSVHRRFTQSLETITAALPTADITSSELDPKLPDPLASIERGLQEPGARLVPMSDHVDCIEVQDHAQEAREALRWLKARIVRDKVLRRSCAVVVPDVTRYQPYLQEAASEFGLPIRFPYGRQLSTAPSIAILLEILDLPLRNWPRRATLDAFRSPYFDFASLGLTTADAAALEIASLHGQVVAGMDQWTEALRWLATAEASSEEDLEEALSALNPPRGAEAERLMRAMQALAHRLAPPDSQTITAWVRWLEDLLDELHFFETSDTPRDIAAHKFLREALRALVLAESVAGKTTLKYAAFLTELRRTLEATTYHEPSEWKMQKVSVLMAHEARGLRFDAVAVLGLSEGMFPEVEREDPFLADSLRLELGLEPRLGRHQNSLFYQAITRADKYLLLSRPYLADDGEQWEPSPFWRAATSLLEGESHLIQPQAQRPLPEAASAEELLFWAVRREKLPAQYEETLLSRWEQLRHARDVLSERRIPSDENLHDGSLAEIAQVIAAKYGSQYLWSATRLETYGTCPYMFFVSNAMDLEAVEPPTLGFDARQLGSMLHTILENIYRTAGDPADPESVLSRLPAIAQAEFEMAPKTYGFRPTMLWELEQENLLQALEKTVHAIAEVGEGWVPIAFEQAFGILGNPPLEIRLAKETLRLRGLIDRVDQDSSGNLRIVDYKTGSGHLSKGDLLEGRRLQLPLYALGARDALGLGQPVEGFYWAILAARHGSLRLGSFTIKRNGEEIQGPQAAIEVAKNHIQRIVDGVRSGKFMPVAPRGGCPSYCPASAWCWHYASTGWR